MLLIYKDVKIAKILHAKIAILVIFVNMQQNSVAVAKLTKIEN